MSSTISAAGAFIAYVFVLWLQVLFAIPPVDTRSTWYIDTSFLKTDIKGTALTMPTTNARHELPYTILGYLLPGKSALFINVERTQQ